MHDDLGRISKVYANFAFQCFARSPKLHDRLFLVDQTGVRQGADLGMTVVLLLRCVNDRKRHGQGTPLSKGLSAQSAYMDLSRPAFCIPLALTAKMLRSRIFLSIDR
jgi:hypothetical protein